MSRWPFFALLVALGCNSATGSKVAAAAITTTAAVAAAAINRAATEECWADCSPGYGCDETSGLCVPLAELEGIPAVAPPEDEDDACITEDDGSVACPEDADLPAIDPLEQSSSDDASPLEQVAPPAADPLEAGDGAESSDPLEQP